MTTLITTLQSLLAASQRSIALPALKAALGSYQLCPVSAHSSPFSANFGSIKGWQMHNPS